MSIIEQATRLVDASAAASATIDTPLGDAVKFHSMGGIEGLSRPFVYEIDVVSRRADIKASELLGQSVTVQLETGNDDGEVRHWNGAVTGLQYIDTSDDGDSRYRLTMRPWLWELSRSADCRIFQKMSVPEIVTQIFQDRGFTDYERVLFEDYAQREYVVQYRETDLQFISRLLEREGIYYFFRHEDGKHTLVLGDSPQAHQSSAGCEQLSYAPDDEHRDATTQYMRRWRSEAQLETGVYAQSDFDFTKPQVQLFAQASSPDDAAANLKVYDYPGGFDNFAAGDTYARLRLDQSRRDAQRWTGECNARAMTVGCTFELTDHPRDDQNQGYLVTWARYRIKGQDERSTGDDEESYVCTLVAIDAEMTFRPPLAAPKPLMRGPQTAIVVGPSGQEIWTDQYGRVKVQFPWDRVGESDENSSCWVRVSQAWAGGGFGGQFIPRIGHEVIVDFLEGDPDRPIITGCVYNGSNMPPFDLPNNQTQSGVRTRSSPGSGGSNEIRFEDATGAEDMYIHAEGTQTTVVERSQSIGVGGDRTVTVTGSETVGIAGGRSTTIALDDTLSVVGAATTTVVGNHSLAVAGSAETAVVGTYSLSVEGSASESVSGDLTINVTGAVDSTIAGGQTETHGDDLTQRYEGHRTVIVGGPKAERSSLLHVEGTARTYASGAIDIVSLESFTVTCGKSQIVVKPDGVTITTPKLMFVTPDAGFAGAKFAVAATDSATIGGKSVTVSSSGASLALDSNATLQGGKVQLKGGSGSSASSDTKDPKVTTITVADQDGQPLAHQRIILRTGGEDGPERTVVVGDDGTIDIPGDEPFEIRFPDVADAKKK